MRCSVAASPSHRAGQSWGARIGGSGRLCAQAAMALGSAQPLLEQTSMGCCSLPQELTSDTRVPAGHPDGGCPPKALPACSHGAAPQPAGLSPSQGHPSGVGCCGGRGGEKGRDFGFWQGHCGAGEWVDSGQDGAAPPAKVPSMRVSPSRVQGCLLSGHRQSMLLEVLKPWQEISRVHRLCFVFY